MRRHALALVLTSVVLVGLGFASPAAEAYSAAWGKRNTVATSGPRLLKASKDAPLKLKLQALRHNLATLYAARFRPEKLAQRVVARQVPDVDYDAPLPGVKPKNTFGLRFIQGLLERPARVAAARVVERRTGEGVEDAWTLRAKGVSPFVSKAVPGTAGKLQELWLQSHIMTFIPIHGVF